MEYPRKDMGPVELLWDGSGVPPRKDMGPVKVEVLWDGDWEHPPEETHTCET